MTFDMRNWHLMGGIPLEVRKRPEIKQVDEANEIFRSFMQKERSDPGCQSCGFVECECLQIEYC